MRRLFGAAMSWVFRLAARPPRWQPAGPGVQSRAYRKYEDYLSHQRLKLGLMGDLTEYDARFTDALRQRLAESGLIAKGMRVLCLGARRGAEVKAFQDLGCFAVGLDLNPGRRNRYVLYGDFHSLAFP